jgi:outer membrane protein TolC
MKNFKFIFLTLFLAVLGIDKPLWGDDMAGMEMGSATAPTTIELTLPKAEEMALGGNPHIHAADKRVEAAGKQSLQTLAPADPTFILDDTFANTNMWQVEENLGFPGKSLAQVDVDNAETEKQRAMANDTRRSILLQTRQTFWDFYYRQKIYGVLDDAQTQWKSLSQVLKSRELTGQWLSMKTVRAQLEIANATNELFTASDDLAVSRVNFNHLFSLPHETAYVLKEIPNLPPLARTVQHYIQRAMAGNPMVEAAQRELDEAGAQAHVVALSHLPDFTVALSGTRNPEDTGFSYWGFRVGVSVPLFFPIKQTQATDQANDQVDASQYELTGAQNETTHMVEEAYVNAQSSWRLWKLYEEGGLLAQTQRAWKATRAAYRNDQIPLSDFVDNYDMYLDTLKSYYKAQSDYGKALADLDYQIGNLPVSEKEKE